MSGVTVIELKTCTKPPAPNSKEHFLHEMQLAVQLNMAQESPGTKTAGLERIDYKDKDDRDCHRYELFGKPIPGVTSVLGLARGGWKPNRDFMDRGTWGHAICTQIDQQMILQEWIDSLPNRAERMGHTRSDGELWRNWFMEYIKFKIDHKLYNECIWNETPFASKELKVAATLDKYFESQESQGYLLYLSSGPYKVYPLKPDEKFTSYYQEILNGFKRIKWVYDFRGDFQKEQKQIKENKK
jgi:hypothetical protein